MEEEAEAEEEARETHMKLQKWVVLVIHRFASCGLKIKKT
jgi:hypothetical protein